MTIKTENKKYHKLRWIGIGLVILAVLFVSLSTFGAKAAMELPRLSLPKETPATLGLKFESISFKSRDDVITLKGWFLPGQLNSAVIIVHGGYQNRVDENVDTLGLAHDLVQNGWSILLFDLRGRGESEGQGLSLSNIEKDIGGAVDYLKQRGFFEKRISVMGFCSGAASACIFASQNNIGALILDGCFADVRDMVVRQADLLGIPEFLVELFIPGVLIMAKIMYKYDVVNPKDVVNQITCPIFFIHEEKDEVVSLQEMEFLYQKSQNTANQIWEVKGTAHSHSYKDQPVEYIEKVGSFLSQNLLSCP